MNAGAFALGTFSLAGGSQFAGVAIGDQVLPVRALSRHMRANEIPPGATDTLLGLLEYWPRNRCMNAQRGQRERLCSR